MYADRYAPRRVNRGSLGLSVGIVAPLLAAAMLASPVVRGPFKDPILTIYRVPPPPPPPKPEPLKPKVQAKARPAPPFDQPIQQVQTEPKTDFTPPPEPARPTDPGALDGAGTATVIEPVKPAPPVVTGVEVDQRYARDFQPLYPPAEQRAGRDGVVTLKVLVGVDGRVVRAEQVTATSGEFWRVTQKQALAKWRFRPATRDGMPVEAWRTMTVRFRLEDAGA